MSEKGGDYFVWTRDQAQRLRDRVIEGLDFDALADHMIAAGDEAIERAENVVIEILKGLLEWYYAPKEGTDGFLALSQPHVMRRVLKDRIEEMPSILDELKRRSVDLHEEAATEAELWNEPTMPEEDEDLVIFTWEQITDPNFWPASPVEGADAMLKKQLVLFAALDLAREIDDDPSKFKKLMELYASAGLVPPARET